MKKMSWITICFIVVAGSLFSAGCQVTGDKQADAAITGAGVGALAGQLIGGNTKGTLIGAGIGALGGAVIGGQQKTNDRVNQIEAQQNTEIVVIENTNGSKSTVTLRKDGYGGYIGPRGEQYTSMPTKEQLRQVYGF